MSAADVIVKPDSKNTYFARRSDLTLVRTPQQKLYSQNGAVRGQTDPDRVRFKDGMFECPHTGKVLIDGGQSVDAAELNEWLQGHRIFGDPFEGFTMQQMPAPAASQDELRAIMGATGDRQELLEILKAENEGFKRPEVLELVAEAIERLDAAQAPQAAPEKARTGAKA